MRWRAVWTGALGMIVLGAFVAMVWPAPIIRALPELVHARLVTRGGRYAALRDIPWTLQAAVIAAEDERFYANPGVDLLALGRAAIADLEAGHIVQGGSTITEELADVMLVHGDQAPLRRLTTMWLAVRIARTFSKARVLEMYLNAVYFGEGAYGIRRAARVYFHHPVQSLDLAQSALLAGLLRGPSRYDPLHHPQRALRRTQEVLAAMVSTRAATPQAAAAAARELAHWLAGPRGGAAGGHVRTRVPKRRGVNAGALRRVHADHVA